MNSHNQRARLESALARAHQSLYTAQSAAEALGDNDGHDELYDIMTAVGRLMERSLRPHPNREIPWSMRFNAPTAPGS